MTTLALHGGEPEVKGPIRPYNSIGNADYGYADEYEAVRCFMVEAETGRRTLSGYLGGHTRGGHFVNALEDAWADRFKVRHAIAVNSATSGLFAAAAAALPEIGGISRFAVSPFTMSATVAAPMMANWEPHFIDISPDTFCLDFSCECDDQLDAVLVTNLFGHPAQLDYMRTACDRANILSIEDNAQAPFAMVDQRYAGTIGHIGVFSLNVHKHIQCGEGGIVVTDSDALAESIRLFRNHGEMAGVGLGLNLRMTEMTAAIALAQLARADELIAGRIALAEALTAAVKGLPGLTPPYVHPSCRHVYYCWALKVADWPPDDDEGVSGRPLRRNWIVKALQAEGVPIRAGYVDPLYRLKAFAPYARPCPVAERMHDRELALFEICAHDPTPEQIKQIGNAFEKVATHAYAHA